MKVLIFGSNGMVGSSLAKKLKQNFNFSSVITSSRGDTNLFSFRETLSKIEKESPDIIVNCAAMVGGIVANNKMRTEFIINNLKINLNILESIKEFNNIKMINLGSSCIYPLGAKIPIKEESLMTGKLEPTNSPYAMAKLSAIEIGDSMTKQYGHKILNLMPTNLYGQNDNFDLNSSHVIPGLISRMHQAKSNNKNNFNVWGTGKPLREFLHVDDLSNAIEFTILNNIDSGIYNVGSGEEISIFDLAKKIKNIVGFKGEIIFDSDFPDGNPRKLLDSSKLNKLGWTSRIKLDEGLIMTYKWFLKNNAT